MERKLLDWKNSSQRKPYSVTWLNRYRLTAIEHAQHPYNPTSQNANRTKPSSTQKPKGRHR